MSQEKGTDNLYKRPGYIFILSLPLTRGARHSLRIKSFYFTAANIHPIFQTSKQIPRFFHPSAHFFSPIPQPQKKICPAMLPLPANILSTFSAGNRTDAPYALLTPVSNPYLTRCKPVSYKNHLHSTYTTVTHYEHEIMPMKWNFC